MKEINLKLPTGSVQKGQLYDEYDIDELDQDIIEIDLPSGDTIEAGWYPEYDKNGGFRITVFRQFWEKRRAGPFTVKSIRELKRLLEGLANYFVFLDQAEPVNGSGAESKITPSQSLSTMQQIA